MPLYNEGNLYQVFEGKLLFFWSIVCTVALGVNLGTKSVFTLHPFPSTPSIKRQHFHSSCALLSAFNSSNTSEFIRSREQSNSKRQRRFQNRGRNDQATGTNRIVQPAKQSVLRLRTDMMTRSTAGDKLPCLQKMRRNSSQNRLGLVQYRRA